MRAGIHRVRIKDTFPMKSNHSPLYPDSPAEQQVDEFVSVLIVGGGPTGLAAANLLGQEGIETLILERNTHLSNSPKALSLDDEGLRICQAMGLSNSISMLLLSDISPQYEAAGRLLLTVAPGGKRNGYPLISTFNQPEFEAALLHGLERFSCVDVRFQSTVETLTQTKDSVIACVRTPGGACQKIGCSYLLACDGGSSTIRRLLGIAMKGMTYPQKWLVVDCIDDETLPTIAKCFCNPSRPAVTVPSPRSGRRWEFMLLPGEDEKEMLREGTIAALIQQGGGSPCSQVIRQAVYSFHSKLAQSFSRGRVFLLGDAAHMMPPFGGQGLNSGLRDAHNLTWKLTLVLRGLASPRLLDTYHQERHLHAAQMISFSSLLAGLIMSRKRPVAFCRNLLFQALNSIPAVRQFLSEARIKPQPRYKHGFFLSADSQEGRAITGLLLPQPEVITTQGQSMLLDEVLGSGFALLRLHHNPREAFGALTALQTDFWCALGARFVCVQVDGNGQTPRGAGGRPSYLRALRNEPSHVVVRSNGHAFERLSQDQFIVVRPDRFILGVFTEQKADRFVSALQKRLQASA
jgi:3-(3-hydroxy-phenyl)propionate hydroxylase